MRSLLVLCLVGTLTAMITMITPGCYEGATGEDPEATGEPIVPDYASYCATINETSTGDLQQYGATAQCMATCAGFAPGAVGDEIGNSVGCRMHYALEASEDPQTHCRVAGPGGNGVCGSNCEGFCQIQSVACVGPDQQFSTITQCIDVCNQYDPSVAYSSMVTAGDSLACRLYHLTVASASAQVHCPHIGAVSAVCF